MAKHITQSDSSPAKKAATVGTVTLHAVVDIGTTGAPTVSKSPDSAFGITRTSTGLYALTYPTGKRAWIHVGLYSPLLTVVGCVTTALAPNSGTASITTLAGTNAAVATDPASGNKLYITIDVEG